MAHVSQEMTQIKQQHQDLNQNYDLMSHQQQLILNQNSSLETRQSIMENNLQEFNKDNSIRHDELRSDIGQILLLLQPTKNPPRECITSRTSVDISAITGDTTRHPKQWEKSDGNDTTTAPSTCNSQNEAGTYTQKTTMDIEDDDPAPKL